MKAPGVGLPSLLLPLLCCSSLVHGKSCSLWVSPEHPVIPYGEPVVLNCSTTCGDYLTLDWETSVRKNLSRGDQWVALYIANLSAWTLTPLCYIIGSPDHEEYLPVTLLAYTFSSPEIHLRGEMVAGQEERVTCNVSSTVAGTTPSDMDLTLGGGGKVLARGRGLWLEHVFTAGAEHDGARLVCSARLQVGNWTLVKNQTASMAVFYKPTSTNVQTERRTFRAGQNFTLSCHSAGNPAPELTWRLPSNESVEVADDGRTVSVYSARAVHSGTYECTASNKYGASTARTNMILEENASGNPNAIPPWAIAFIVLFALGVVGVAGFAIRRAFI